MTANLKRNREVEQSTTPQIKGKRSIRPFKASRRQTMNASYLTPIRRIPVIPGQSLFLDLSIFGRLMTQITCPMDNLQVSTYAFYCPDRLVWDNHPYFIGAQKDPNVTEEYIVPQIVIPKEKNTANSLANYLTAGRIGVSLKLSALEFRKHNLIWNEYFRDPDCQSPKLVKKDDSDDDINDYDLYRIHKSRDYFTNSTRDIQIGSPVTIPIGTEADVKLRPAGANSQSQVIRNIYSGQVSVSAETDSSHGLLGRQYGALNNETASNVFERVNIDPNGTLYTDLSNALGTTMTAFSQAIMTEQFQMALNRGGTKYTDVMANIYNVHIPDLTIQRPVYLGGTTTYLTSTPVVQTSGTSISGSNTPQGNLAGFGVVADGGNIINASFQEFGSVIIYAVVKAQPQYQQGIDKTWTIKDRLEYFNPFFTELGDQAITQGEIYYSDHDAEDENGQLLNDKIFGYIGRNDEFRYSKNEIAGELNSEYEYTLDSWHYGEKFEEAPVNNSSFMEDKTYEILERTLAVKWEDENNTIKAPQLLMEFTLNGANALPMPTHSSAKLFSELY